MKPVAATTDTDVHTEPIPSVHMYTRGVCSLHAEEFSCEKKGRVEGGREGEGRKRRGRNEREEVEGTLLVGLNQVVRNSWVIGGHSHSEGIARFLGVADIEGLKERGKDESLAATSHSRTNCNRNCQIAIYCTAHDKELYQQRVGLHSFSNSSQRKITKLHVRFSKL